MDFPDIDHHDSQKKCLESSKLFDELNKYFKEYKLKPEFILHFIQNTHPSKMKMDLLSDSIFNILLDTIDSNDCTIDEILSSGKELGYSDERMNFFLDLHPNLNVVERVMLYTRTETVQPEFEHEIENSHDQGNNPWDNTSKKLFSPKSSRSSSNSVLLMSQPSSSSKSPPLSANSRSVSPLSIISLGAAPAQNSIPNNIKAFRLAIGKDIDLRTKLQTRYAEVCNELSSLYDLNKNNTRRDTLTDEKRSIVKQLHEIYDRLLELFKNFTYPEKEVDLHFLHQKEAKRFLPIALKRICERCSSNPHCTITVHVITGKNNGNSIIRANVMDYFNRKKLVFNENGLGAFFVKINKKFADF